LPESEEEEKWGMTTIGMGCFWGNENALKADNDYGCTSLWLHLKTTELYTLNKGWIV
jgi:hypothetical protein